MGQVKDCKNCSQQFKIPDDDLAFYQKLEFPPPTHCPDCRKQRRFALRNELNLHRRICDKCQKPMISVYPEDSPYTVYCNKCWHADDWSPMDYGRDYDFSKPFFQQFAELEKSIPHFSLFQDDNNENCEYINYGIENKSCYLAVVAYCEDVYYSHGPLQSKSSMDCGTVTGCELCYDCVDCTGCYDLMFGQDCYNSSESRFLIDCIGCSNCFCSVGLRNKQYVFENKQLTKEEYEEKISQIKLTNESIKEWKNKLRAIELETPKKYIHGRGSQNVTGDYIDNCKNLVNCYDCLGGIEDSKYCDLCGLQTHHLYDAYAAGIGSTFSLELNGCTNVNNCKCIYYIRQLQDSAYCQICYNGENLFGCFGLKHKKFCILNKQYTEEEYNELLPKVIEHMKQTGEYGEFFPIENAPVAYNESIAQQYFPLTKEQALAKGYKWHDRAPRQHRAITDDLINCKSCQKQFKLISQEKAFYQKMQLPNPENCPECRHNNRFHRRNPFKLHDRECQKCNTPIRTTYSPDSPEIVYCEKCYLEAL